MSKRLLGRMAQTPPELRRKDDDPKIMQERIDTFFNTSMPAIHFYHRLGKVSKIDAEGTPDEVYERTFEALHPTLITISGGSKINEKNSFGRQLASLTRFAYINCRVFFSKRRLKSSEDQVSSLIDFLQEAPFNNFVLEHFPETDTQALLFYAEYTNPYAHFDITTMSSKVKREDFWYKIDPNIDLNSQIQQAMKYLNPKLILAYTDENEVLGRSILRQLTEQNNYIILDYEDLIESEKHRCTTIGKNFSEGNNQYFFEFLKKIIFSNIKRNKKFILFNFPEKLQFLKEIENKILPIEKILYFLEKNEENWTISEPGLSGQWENIFDKYGPEGKIILLSPDTITTLEKKDNLKNSLLSHLES